MNGWEWRQIEKFGDKHFLTWKNHPLTPETKTTYIRVVYVDEAYLSNFVGVTQRYMRQWIRVALTYHNLMPDDITFTPPTTDVTVYDATGHTALSVECKGMGYQWQALDAILSVPDMVNRRYRVKISGVMKELCRLQTGDDYEYRLETEEEKTSRSQREYEQGQQQAKRFLVHMEQQHPGFESALRSVASVATRGVRDIMALYKRKRHEELTTQDGHRLLHA